MKGSLLARMTWEEAGAALKEGQVVVVPVGSIEQHGPHMPVGTDTAVADVMARAVAARAKCVVTPTIPIGYADYHTDFPGTLSVSPRTLEAYIWESISNLVYHGATHILFLNAHGGNRGSLDQICYRLRRRGIVAATILWWDVLGVMTPDRSPAGHGDWIETALMMATDPEALVMERAGKPQVRDLGRSDLSLQGPHTVLYKQVPIHVSLATRDFSGSGDMPEPWLTPHGQADVPLSRSTPELGKDLIDTVAGFVAEFLDVFRQIKLREENRRD